MQMRGAQVSERYLYTCWLSAHLQYFMPWRAPAQRSFFGIAVRKTGRTNISRSVAIYRWLIDWAPWSNRNSSVFGLPDVSRRRVLECVLWFGSLRDQENRSYRAKNYPKIEFRGFGTAGISLLPDLNSMANLGVSCDLESVISGIWPIKVKFSHLIRLPSLSSSKRIVFIIGRARLVATGL